MDNIQSFKRAIDFIEDHLTEKINYNEIARILAVSEQSMQRIFVFITNISLSEYIKRRRFSKAYEELKNSNIKVLDLAIKYQYESDISFSRAFKELFGMTPSECRNSITENIQFPVFQINENEKPNKYSYRIEKIEKPIVIYAYGIQSTKTKQDFLFRIRELYQEIKDKGLYNRMEKTGMYGVTIKNIEDELIYWLGCQENFGDSQKIVLDSGNYLVFDCEGRDQSDIASLIVNIYSQFIKSSNYELDQYFCFEYYQNNTCYVYFKVND